jgi:hypothetical protein
MSKRVLNAVMQARYRKLKNNFLNFRSGDLVQISLELPNSSGIKVRQLSRNDKDKFTYLHPSTFPRTHSHFIPFANGQIGIFLGRYDAKAVLLINEGLYSVPVDCLKKVEEII